LDGISEIVVRAEQKASDLGSGATTVKTGSHHEIESSSEEFGFCAQPPHTRMETESIGLGGGETKSEKQNRER
jgi:hypothetical protein